MGKINFVRKFILAYAEIVKSVTAMMKKDAKVKWSNEAKEEESIMQSIMFYLIKYS